jgi:hypothetical protein
MPEARDIWLSFLVVDRATEQIEQAARAVDDIAGIRVFTDPLIPEDTAYVFSGAPIFEAGPFEFETPMDFDIERTSIPFTFRQEFGLGTRRVPRWRMERDRAESCWRDLDRMQGREVFGWRWWRLLWRGLRHDWRATRLRYARPGETVELSDSRRFAKITGIT